MKVYKNKAAKKKVEQSGRAGYTFAKVAEVSDEMAAKTLNAIAAQLIAQGKANVIGVELHSISFSYILETK